MADKSVGIFRVAAAAVIVNDQGQVLLTQRALNREHHPGEWEILAGRLNQGESFEDALSREAKEELNIELKIISLLSTFHFFRGDEKVEHVGVAFLAKHLSGEVTVDGLEEVAYKWLSFTEAVELVKDVNIKQNLLIAEQYLKDLS